ncbi:thiamine phosphate synthase [Marinilabilia salmonicolor]|uniref:thiamine phosphate synthase n=1 Tax=Marinilabilia salmonicolor TaxID=989 RepID=UPI00029B0684|nr:thiamine phosphate synthase [Marinilabilia salmonicolor]
MLHSKIQNPGIYVIITQPQLPYITIAEKCVENNISMIQLREKQLPDRELLKIAQDLRAVTRGTNTRLVINDRPDIARLCEADVLHLGQDDMTLKDARKIVGDIKIGLSTHSLEQARTALKQKPDYIGFGPVYPTNAKANPDPPVGTELLAEVLAFANVPVIAIGGIFPENLDEVLETGARNIAMVRHFMQTKNFEGRIKELQKRLDSSIL